MSTKRGKFFERLRKGSERMPRGSKPINACKGHRTKAEIKLREDEEKNCSTGNPLTEFKSTKENKTAHKEFLRVRKLLQKIDKDDDLYSAITNRYCIIGAEISDFENKIKQIQLNFEKLEADYNDDKIDAEFYWARYDSLQKSIISYDSKIMTKRKMLLDIEKENSMTVASNLRNIPKTPEKKENPLIKALLDDE